MAEVLERDVKTLKSQRPPLVDGPELDNSRGLDRNPTWRFGPSPTSVPLSSTTDLSGRSGPESFLSTSAIMVDSINSGRGNLTSSILAELVNTWFSDYHCWIPILHKVSLLKIMRSSAHLVDSPLNILFKAITAVTITCRRETKIGGLSDRDRQRLSLNFRGQVVSEAMGHLSLQSLQALIIISILDYGSGNFSEFWNVIAICKRRVYNSLAP